MSRLKKQRVLKSGMAFGEEDDEETRFQIVKIMLEEFPELKEHVRKYVESTRLSNWMMSIEESPEG